MPATTLRRGDVFVVAAGDVIPCDGEVLEGVASVDESAITGESAPVIRESGGDRNTVTGGTRDPLRLAGGAGHGGSRRDLPRPHDRDGRGRQRQKTPNEIALTILLVALTLVFLFATATLLPFSIYAVTSAGGGRVVSVTVLVALLVCLIPTTIGGLLSAIGIAGMDRLLHANVMAMSGRAVEAAGDVDVLLLDKTGTITLGNRQATELIPAGRRSARGSSPDAAQLASLSDETPEGRSIVVLAKERYGLRERNLETQHPTFVPFTAQTRMSGVDLDGRMIRKGAADAIEIVGAGPGGRYSRGPCRAAVEDVARQGATPLVVAGGGRVLGVIRLKDVVKGGIRERFAQLRKMGISTVMITGDNPLTAAAIAAEAGVDDFLAEATPEAKLTLIRRHQEGGKLVAMTGDGTNDAPALAQAGRGRGDELRHAGGQGGRQHGGPRLEPHQAHRDRRDRQAAADDARRAHHLQHHERRRQVLRDHPRRFRGHLPGARGAERDAPRHARRAPILSAVIFNALIIIALIPLALRGVRYRPLGASAVLRQNLSDLRRRRADRAVRRDQADRHAPDRPAADLRARLALRDPPRPADAGRAHRDHRRALSIGSSPGSPRWRSRVRRTGA